VDRRPATLVVHRLHLDPRGILEQLEGEAARGRGAGRAVVQPRAVRPGVGDELGNGLHLEAGVHDQDLRIAHHQHDRREVLHHVVGQLLVEVRVGSEGVESHHARVAVRGRFRELRGAHDASRGDAGTAQLAKAPADGYAIMMTFDTFASNPHLYRELPYDVVKDFAPIMLIVRYPQILVVHPSLKVKTVPEFVAYAKANGAKLNYGSAGPASSSRLAFELFKETAGIELEAVHYKGGGPAINDLLAGTVQVMLIQAGGAIGQNVKSGKLVGLATSGRQRSPHFPDLPTIADFYPGFETTSWVGVIAP